MKFTFKKLVVALALATAAGQAGAAMVQANSGDGDMFLTVWDTNNTVSYSRDLGVSLSGFLPNAVTGGTQTPDAGLTHSYATDSVFNSAFGSINQTSDPLIWNVVAGDSLTVGLSQHPYTPGAIQVLTTLSTASPTTLTNAGNYAAGQAINNFQIALNTATGYGVGGLGPNCGTAVSCFNSNVGNQGFGGSGSPINWNVLATGLLPTTGGVGQALNFWYITGSGGTNLTGPTAVATQILFQNSQDLANMTMDASGNLTYSLAPAVSAVPVPAAVWLFGSGLLGLVGIARRKLA